MGAAWAALAACVVWAEAIDSFLAADVGATSWTTAWDSGRRRRRAAMIVSHVSVIIVPERNCLLSTSSNIVMMTSLVFFYLSQFVVTSLNSVEQLNKFEAKKFLTTSFDETYLCSYRDPETKKMILSCINIQTWLLRPKSFVYYINLHGESDVTVTMSKYWRFHKVRYIRVWQNFELSYHPFFFFTITN